MSEDTLARGSDVSKAHNNTLVEERARAAGEHKDAPQVQTVLPKKSHDADAYTPRQRWYGIRIGR
jgi:hypothetical protein